MNKAVAVMVVGAVVVMVGVIVWVRTTVIEGADLAAGGHPDYPRNLYNLALVLGISGGVVFVAGLVAMLAFTGRKTE